MNVYVLQQKGRVGYYAELGVFSTLELAKTGAEAKYGYSSGPMKWREPTNKYPNQWFSDRGTKITCIDVK